MILNESGYKKQFENTQSEEDQQRLANIEELLSEAREFDQLPLMSENSDTPLIEARSALEIFLEQTALVGDVDKWDNAADRVSLMTLHAAKGLEFPVAYIIALEEGILPHERSQDDEAQLEEERRLFFVGMTRAMEELRISRVLQREFRGSFGNTVYSRFLLELPNDHNVEKFDSPGEVGEPREIDRGDGVRLVLEKQALTTLVDTPDELEPEFVAEEHDIDYDEAIIEYDAVDPEYDEDGTMMTRKPQKPKKKRPVISASVTTAAELYRNKNADEPKTLEDG